MGLLSKIIAAKATAAVVQRLNAKARTQPVPGQQDYIPAGETGIAPSRGNALMDKATGLYRQNPKLVAGLGVVVAAAVLQQLTRKRSF